ncbi:hypothetical protein LCGC14_3096550 [marine sediment metagenome]|uniref:Uncharacterized protein n=1 Tax=marine sediment metagenome TaxID=412755 RepID=A0A0F8WXT4_9ZZZZ
MRVIECLACGSHKSTGVWGIYMCGECGCGEGKEVDIDEEWDYLTDEEDEELPS